MRSFTYSMHIERPPDEVFSFLIDFKTAPRWRSLVRTIELVTPAPMGEGSKLRVTFDVMGKIRQAISEVWVFDPPRRYGLTNTASNITGVFEYSVEPEGTGTRVRFTCDIKPHGLMWLVLPFALRSNRLRYRDQLDRLKTAVEGRVS